MNKPGLSTPTRVALLAAIYFLAGLLANLALSVAPDVLLVWPVVGLSLGTILILGYRFWPVVIVGTLLFVAGLAKPFGLWILFTVLGNLAGSCLGAWVLQRFAGFTNSLGTVRQVGVFALGALLLAGALGALFSVAGAAIAQSAPWHATITHPLKFWLINTLGVLLIAPLMLTWKSPLTLLKSTQVLEALMCAIGLLLTACVSLTGIAGTGMGALSVLPFPFLVWGALRFGPRGAAIGTFAVSAIAIDAFLHRRGPFVSPADVESIWSVATYLGIIALSNLFLAAIGNERERVVHEARANEKRYRAVVEDQSDLICRFNLQGDITFVNRAYCRFHGKTSQQLIGTSFMPSLPSEDREIPLSVFATLTPDEPTLSFDDKLLSPDGKLVWQQCTIHALFDEAGRAYEFQSVIHDITARKELEETLREREEFFRVISECMNDMIAVLDRDGRRIYNSPSYQTVLGDPTDLVGTNSFMEIHPDDRESIHRIFQETVSTGTGRRAEFRFVRKDGSIRFIESQGSVVRDKSGQTNKVVVVSRDITERMTLETKLRQAQKLEAIGRLAGGIAHDFNNLMQAIIGYTNLLLQRLRETDSNRDTIEQIEKSAERAAALTAQLLAFSRKQVLKPKIFSLDASVTDVGKLLRRLIGEHIQIATAPAVGGHCVSADPGQIEQVILNLSLNARDAMPEGGTLSIATTTLEISEKLFGFSDDFQPGPFVRLSVSDTGTGMTPEVKAHLFEPFFTTKGIGKGTGLGLSIVYGIVRQSGGEIIVESELGHGTTFHVYLPQAQSEAPAQIPVVAAPAPAQKGGGETLLLVEDEEIVRAMLSEVLRAQGYNVLEAHHGLNAVEIAGQHQKPIDLLISDMLMPEMNGWELAQTLALTRPTLPVLYISGYSDDEARRFGKFDGPAQFLQKPFRPDALLGRVREILDAQLQAA